MGNFKIKHSGGRVVNYSKPAPVKTGFNCRECEQPLTTTDTLHATKGLCTFCTFDAVKIEGEINK